MPEVVYADNAVKGLRRMPRGDVVALMAKIDAHAADRTKGDVKKLKGSSLFRLRHGDYRATFSISGEVLEVHDIAHRRDIYR